MHRIIHRFIHHPIHPRTKILILGTFNPDTPQNTAEFFYGRQRNFLWKLLPLAFGQSSLKDRSVTDKQQFMKQYQIDFIDLIKEVLVDEPSNYDDYYLDDKVAEWRDVIGELELLPELKMVCLTRKTFSGIPNIKKKVVEVARYCEVRKIDFCLLPTPARIYSQRKQEEWNKFFNA